MKSFFLNPPAKRFFAFAATLVALCALALCVSFASPAQAYANSGTVTYSYAGGTKKEVKFTNDIPGLFSRAKSESGDIVIDLLDDWDTSNYRIEVPANRNYTINLHGHMINRGKASTDWYGAGDQDVIIVNEGATLTVNGASSDAEKATEHKGTLYDDKKFWKAESNGSTILKGGLITGGACDDQYGAGGISLKGSKAKLHVNDTTIAGNVTDTYSWFNNYGYGAGIAVHGSSSTLELSNTKLVYNHAESSGGGIYVRNSDCSVTIKNGSEISNNRSAKCGGGIYIDGNNTKLLIDSKSKVSNNASANEGGGIYHNGKNGEVTVKDGSAISNNSAGKDGGGIYDYYNGTKFSFDASEVSGNSAGSSSSGGGIYLNDEASLSLTNASSISKNTAKYGAGLYVDDDGTTVSLSGESKFQDNEASKEGGAVCLADSAELVLDNSKIDANHATYNGSGVFILNEKFTSITCTVKLNNKSSICNNKSITTTSQGYTYYSRGAAVYVRGGGTFNIISDDDSGTISDNFATDGAAIYVETSDGSVDSYTQASPTTKVKGISIKNNEAKVAAGGIFYYGSLELDTVEIADNKANMRSAGTWPYEEKDLILKGTCIIKDNYMKGEQKNLTLRGSQKILVDASKPPTGKSRIGVSLLDYSGGERVLSESKDFVDAWSEEAGQTVLFSDNGSYSVTCDESKLYLTDEHWLSICDTPKDQPVQYLHPGEEVTLNSSDYVKYVKDGDTSLKYNLDYWTVEGLGDTTTLDASSGSATFTMPTSNVRVYAHYSAPVTALDIQVTDGCSWDEVGDKSKVKISGLKITDATGETYELSEAKLASLAEIDSFRVQDLTERKRVNFELSFTQDIAELFGLYLPEGDIGQATVTINGNFKTGTVQDEKAYAKVTVDEETGDKTISVTGGVSYWPIAKSVTIKQLNINDESQVGSFVQQISEDSTTVPVPDAAGMRFVKWGDLPDGVSEDSDTHELILSNVEDGISLSAYYEPLVNSVEIEVPELVNGSKFPDALKSFEILDAGDKDKEITDAANSGVSFKWEKEDDTDTGSLVQGDTKYTVTITTQLQGGESYRYGFADSLVAKINGKDADSVETDEKNHTQTFTYSLMTGSDTGFNSVLTDFSDEYIACVADYESKLPREAEYKLNCGTVQTAAITWSNESSIDESQTTGEFTLKGSFADSNGTTHEVSKTFVLADLDVPYSTLDSGTYASGSSDTQNVKLCAGENWKDSNSAEIYYYLASDTSQAGASDSGEAASEGASEGASGGVSSVPRESFTKYSEPISISETSTLLIYGKVGNRETAVVEYKYSIKDQYKVSISDGLACDADDHELSTAFVGSEVKIQANSAPEGKVFDKWELTGGSIADFDKIVDKEVATFDMPASEVSLKATYKTKTCTVSFSTDGGSAVDDQALDYGSKVSKPADPTKEGYTFNGWMLDGSAYDFDTPVTSDISLKASWQKAKSDETTPDSGDADDSDGKASDGDGSDKGADASDESGEGSDTKGDFSESSSADASPETGDVGFAAVGALALGSAVAAVALLCRRRSSL